LRLIGHLPPLRNAVRRARYLFAVNRETQAALIRAGADPQRLAIMLDNGVRPQNLRAAPRQVAPEGMLRLLWVGRLEARKALTILLDAMALAADGAAAGLPAVTLQVAGEGPKRSEWEADARKLGLGEAVTFLGAVPPAKMAELYDQADVFVFTSLQDAFGSVVMESLTRALPAIVLNHQGCATVVPDDAAIKIPVTTPRETVAALAAAIDDVRRRPEQLVPLSERALAAARDAQWPNRAAIMTNIYEQVLAGRQSVAPTLQPEPCAA
jgi:glycosyltransferase involved in cell wall biosynthesis